MPSRPNPPRGITLIELTFVLLLMGVLASFAVPRFFMITEVNLKTSARNLAETLLEVSAMATNYSTPFVIQYDMDKQKYCFKQAQFDLATGAWTVLFPDDSAQEITPDPQAKTRCFSLKDGVYFKEIQPLLGPEKKYEKGKLPEWFSPRGVADPLMILLGDQKGRFFTLFVQRFGGQAELRPGRLEYKDYLREILE
jgi:prepilin-type N-terminal cleavage/methylation domain-containing protein